MSFKNIFFLSFFCRDVYQILDGYGISRIETPTFLTHYNYFLENTKSFADSPYPARTRLKDFLKKKKIKAKCCSQTDKHIDSFGKKKNSIEILLVHHRYGALKKIESDFRDFRGEFLLYDWEYSKMYLIRASLRVFDEIIISIKSKDNISIDYKVHDKESLERFNNGKSNYIITPKIDGHLLYIVAIPKTDPLYEVIQRSDDIKNYKYFFTRKNAVYIFSTRQRFLNNMLDKQIFNILSEKYRSYEIALDILDKYVEDKRMTFCFEYVPNPGGLSEPEPLPFNEKDPTRLATETLATKYNRGNVILFRIIEYNDEKRKEYPPSAKEGLNKELDCVKETHLKGFGAVKKHLIEGVSKMLEGQCDFENSIEGFVLDDGINLIKLRYSTYMCLFGKNAIYSYNLFRLLTDLTYKNLIKNMEYPQKLEKQVAEIQSEEKNFPKIFEILKMFCSLNYRSSLKFSKIVLSKLDDDDLSLFSSFSNAFKITNEALVEICYDIFYKGKKIIFPNQYVYDDFLRHFYDIKYGKLKIKAMKNIPQIQ